MQSCGTVWVIALNVMLVLLQCRTNALAQEYRDSLGKHLSPVTSEIVRQNEDAEKALRLLARVEVTPKFMVEFYEPVTGLIVISGAGIPEPGMARDVTPQSRRDLSKLWRQIASGAEMPPPLREAIERSEKRTKRDYHTRPKILGKWGGSPKRDRPFTRSGGYCDSTQYWTDYGECNEWDFTVCLEHWWNGAWAEHHDASHVWTHVCPASGPVAFRVRGTDFDGGVWSVQQNHFRYFHHDDPNCGHIFDDCPYIRTDVEQAQGVRFHFQFLIQTSF